MNDRYRIPFVKYQALGNDYLLIEPGYLVEAITPRFVRVLCDRHYGVGGDGLLLGPFITPANIFRLEIYNPDGSQAEKSGNGLRIFARYLWDQGQVSEEPFLIETAGGIVRCQVTPPGEVVRVEMGVAQDLRSGQLLLDECPYHYYSLSLGNPHCVIIGAHAGAEEARRLGPLIENSPLFPQRTNVQFLQFVNRENIFIEIWERGAGYTLASGSSSCVAAFVAFHLGEVEQRVLVHMPGGVLDVEIAPDGQLTLTGPVTWVFEGRIDIDHLSQLSLG